MSCMTWACKHSLRDSVAQVACLRNTKLGTVQAPVELSDPVSTSRSLLFKRMSSLLAIGGLTEDRSAPKQISPPGLVAAFVGDLCKPPQALSSEILLLPEHACIVGCEVRRAAVE